MAVKSMNGEGQIIDKKSLRIVTRNSPDWGELAKDCVAFATARGGVLLIGLEDDRDHPVPDQKINPNLPDRIRREIAQRTANVMTTTKIIQAENGGEYIQLTVPRSANVPSTTKGQFFIRIDDACKPIVGDDILRLADERSTFPWETKKTNVPIANACPEKRLKFYEAIRGSDRVSSSVKEKDDDELLYHYLLAADGHLTNVGVLCVGRQSERGRLGTAPIIQAIKYNEHGDKIQKWVWDDHTLTPMELVSMIWHTISDFRESYEFSHGFIRDPIPAYDEIVIRELMVNALVHRPYTQAGDIYVNLYPDRIIVVNPGRLPIGVTPQNILHTSVRRNDVLARVFHDMHLMEREGSGYDKMYEVLLSQGRAVPETEEGTDRVIVTIKRRVFKPEVINLMQKVERVYQLSQREKICLGLLTQHDNLKALQLAEHLELSDANKLKPWLGRLLEFGLVQSTGRTRATRYFVAPNVFREFDITPETRLDRIEPHRLQALLIEDLERFPDSAMGEIRKRIGEEIPYKQVKRSMDALIKEDRIVSKGANKGRRYSLSS